MVKIKLKNVIFDHFFRFYDPSNNGTLERSLARNTPNAKNAKLFVRFLIMAKF